MCVRCGHAICTEDDRIEVEGLHEHTQINPHGFLWTFGCFARAPGCVGDGPTTSEFSWFVGTRWRLQLCGGCSWHLGWHFSGEQRSFYGLILDRLARES